VSVFLANEQADHPVDEPAWRGWRGW